MREFKFRVWDGLEMELFKLEDIYWRGEDTGKYDFHEGLEVMQYTGLKDKRGKEIYEGDVLSFVEFNNDEDHGFGPHLNIMDLVVVDWEEYHSGFVLRRTSEHNHRGNMDAIFYGLCSRNNEIPIGAYAVVIGNIYENPELING